MTKPVQKRALQTRSKLLNAARKIVSAHGYSALRVEQVVLDAGVAKGTFFAHFQDKDAMMEIIVGNEIDALLSRAEVLTPPDSLSAFVAQVSPIMGFMTSERYIFDLIIRHSGAAAKEDIGPIAVTFGRQIELFAKWLSQGPFRKDVPVSVLSEGVQALAVQCMALNFCALFRGLAAAIAAWF